MGTQDEGTKGSQGMKWWSRIGREGVAYLCHVQAAAHGVAGRDDDFEGTLGGGLGRQGGRLPRLRQEQREALLAGGGLQWQSTGAAHVSHAHNGYRRVRMSVPSAYPEDGHLLCLLLVLCAGHWGGPRGDRGGGGIDDRRWGLDKARCHTARHIQVGHGTRAGQRTGGRLPRRLERGGNDIGESDFGGGGLALGCGCHGGCGVGDGGLEGRRRVRGRTDHRGSCTYQIRRSRRGCQTCVSGMRAPVARREDGRSTGESGLWTD